MVTTALPGFEPDTFQLHYIRLSHLGHQDAANLQQSPPVFIADIFCMMFICEFYRSIILIY